MDVASMHPTSIEVMNLFGPYTERYSRLKEARLLIKEGKVKEVRLLHNHEKEARRIKTEFESKMDKVETNEEKEKLQIEEKEKLRELQDKLKKNIEELPPRKISHRNAEKFIREIIIDSVRIKIIGKIDGRDEQGNIVETKNRRNRLFSVIPLYEKVQLEVYMWLTDTKQTTHIQNYNGKSKVTRYDHDDTIWNKIIYGLESIVEVIKLNLKN